MKRWDVATIAGVASVVLAILVILFGDNLWERWTSSPKVSQDRGQPALSPLPVADPETPTATPTPTPTARAGGPSSHSLIESICKAHTIDVTFAANGADPPRYRRRAGTVIVPIENCNVETGKFYTRMDYQGEGVVSGDRVSFSYEYSDGEGVPECHVSAQVQRLPRLTGTMFCEASRANLEQRRVELELK